MKLSDFISTVIKECGTTDVDLEIFVYPSFLMPEQKWEILVAKEPNAYLSKITLRTRKDS